MTDKKTLEKMVDILTAYEMDETDSKKLDSIIKILDNDNATQKQIDNATKKAVALEDSLTDETDETEKAVKAEKALYKWITPQNFKAEKISNVDETILKVNSTKFLFRLDKKAKKYLSKVNNGFNYNGIAVEKIPFDTDILTLIAIKNFDGDIKEYTLKSDIDNGLQYVYSDEINRKNTPCTTFDGIAFKIYTEKEKDEKTAKKTEKTA